MNVNIILEKELALFKIPYKKVGDDLYEISLKGGLKTISLSNVERNYSRDNDEAIIKTFVQTIIKPISKLPEWRSSSRSHVPRGNAYFISHHLTSIKLS